MDYDLEGRIKRMEDAIGEVVGVVQEICAKVSAIDDEVDRILSDKVYGRLDGLESEFGTFIGGMNDILDGRRRREYGEKFRGEHPEFGKYEDFGKSLGIDVYDTAASNTYGLGDEDREKAIVAMLDELSGKFDAVKNALNTLNAHETTETPADEKAENEGEKPEGGIAIEIEAGEKPNPDIVSAARRFKEARAK